MGRLTDRMRRHPWLFAALLSVTLLAGNLAEQPQFGRPSNWPSELATLAPLLIVALASTPSILSGGGGLDLSIGPVTVLCNVILVNDLLAKGVTSAWIDVPIILLVGALIGIVNGLLVGVARYRPVIATLATFFVVSGVVQKLGASSIAVSHDWTSSLGAKVGPVPGALILIAVPVTVWLVLSRTAYRRALYCVGGNDTTAFSAGVNVAGTRIVAYGLGGVFAAVAGLALTAVLQSSQAGAIPQYVLVGLTAVALGGTPLMGGRGGMLGSALGAVVLFLMQTLLSALGVSPDWLSVVFGAMLFAGVVLGAQLATGPTAAQTATT